MKTRPCVLIAVFLVLAAGCDNGPIRSSYRPVLPELPRHWKGILGEASWRIEWIGEGGYWRESEVKPGQEPVSISPLDEWSTPVLAWPFWPEKNLLPGMMRPCGALLPWDTYGEKIYLSWRGGVPALFWKELAAANSSGVAGGSEAAGGARLPWYFDWPRFRELLYFGNVPEAVRKDPWLVDWRELSRKTVASGFDRRRIVSRPYTEISISGLGGRWIGSSPFTPLLDAPSGSPLNIRAADTPETWVSPGAVLKCSNDGWVLIPF